MRLPKLLMGSLLLLPLACGGDDGSTVDTGADTSATGPTSGATMSASMTNSGDDDGVDDGVDDGAPTSSSGEPPADGSSSGEPPADGSSSGEPPADSSGSDSGGAVTECETFCAGYFKACGDNPANDYGDEANCVTECEDYSEKELTCKTTHLMNVATDGPAHCAHANIDGGGVC